MTEIQITPAGGEDEGSDGQLAVTPNSAAFFQFLLTSLEAFTDHALLAARAGDVNAIHQTRVYSRRLQSALELLPSELIAQVEPLRKKLRRARRALNDVRNYDVFIEIVEPRTRGQQNKLAYELLHQRFTLLRQKAVVKMQNRLSALGIEDFLPQVVTILTKPRTPLRIDGATMQLELSLSVTDDPAVRARQRLIERWRTIKQLLEDPVIYTSTATDEQVHGLRIEVKRIRYLLELIGQLKLAPAKRAIARLKQLQGGLGTWHDLEEMENHVIAFISDPTFIKTQLDSTRTLMILIAQLRRRKYQVHLRALPQTTGSELGAAIEDLIAKFEAGHLKLHSAPLTPSGQ